MNTLYDFCPYIIYLFEAIKIVLFITTAVNWEVEFH